MIANKIIFAIATLLPLTLSVMIDDSLKFEVEIPTFLQGIFNKVLKSNPMMRSGNLYLDWNNVNGDKGAQDNVLVRITTKGLPTASRRDNMQRRPKVEEGPGVYKSEIVKYPPNYLASRLKYLLKLKEKQEQSND